MLFKIYYIIKFAQFQQDLVNIMCGNRSNRLPLFFVYCVTISNWLGCWILPLLFNLLIHFPINTSCFPRTLLWLWHRHSGKYACQHVHQQVFSIPKVIVDLVTTLGAHLHIMLSCANTKNQRHGNKEEYNFVKNIHWIRF